MRIALAQINPVLGAFAENAQKIIDFANRAHEKRADIAIFSELSLFGYPPCDIVERPELVAQQIGFIDKIVKKLPKNLTVIFGAIIYNSHLKYGGKPFQNVAVLAQKGKRPQFFAKQLLPSYDIFDETRFFEAGVKTGVVRIPKVGRIAITVCEDMWSETVEAGHKIYKNNPLSGIKGVDLVVNISASPYSKTKMESRLKEARRHVKKLKVPFAYVNQVGGQDELTFDGRSFILDGKGQAIVQAATCEEDLVIIDLKTQRSEYRPDEMDRYEVLRKVLVMGIRDFVRKTGQSKIHLGLSGGIDSAMVAALAVDALGPANVVGLLLPGPYSTPGSIDDTMKLARNLGIKTHTVSIHELYKSTQLTTQIFEESNHSANTGQKRQNRNVVSIMEQNLQARLRGLILMAYGNAKQSLLLSTSNKDELATGYGTLYGDMCGALMPIGDLLKSEIYILAKLYNNSHEIIPNEIINKAPSAELAPDQLDQDSLPSYPKLDEAIVKIVEEKKKANSRVENWLVTELYKSEFKRWQAPPILRVSRHGFGRGRRMPISQKIQIKK